MLQIKEYDLKLTDSSLIKQVKRIDNAIKADLKKIENIEDVKNYLNELWILIEEENFSFIKASNETINKITKINTNISIDVQPFCKELKGLDKFIKFDAQKQYVLNDILEFVLGYHKENRTQVLKKIFKKINLQNCVYCLAQYTTSYYIKTGQIYVKGNLDHIFPKSINALVSLSMNNLVPVCAHCNQKKSNASDDKFDFNPFDTITSDKIPMFNFKDVLKINGGKIMLGDMSKLKISNINKTLEHRLSLTSLYGEYDLPIINMIDRYQKFNSLSYANYIKGLTKMNIPDSLEYFISEMPYTEENIQNIPLHKFKSDLYKELEECKRRGKVKFK